MPDHWKDLINSSLDFAAEMTGETCDLVAMDSGDTSVLALPCVFREPTYRETSRGSMNGSNVNAAVDISLDDSFSGWVTPGRFRVRFPATSGFLFEVVDVSIDGGLITKHASRPTLISGIVTMTLSRIEGEIGMRGGQ